jgi:hypothetical protein
VNDKNISFQEERKKIRIRISQPRLFSEDSYKRDIEKITCLLKKKLY